MVEEIIIYKCAICGSRDKNKKFVEECEAKGFPTKHPIGTIYQMYKEPKMVFAIMQSHIVGHYASYLTWACRDNGHGDNCSGNNFCGFEGYTNIYPPDTSTPAYKRMIKALKKENITFTNYKGREDDIL